MKYQFLKPRFYAFVFVSYEILLNTHKFASEWCFYTTEKKELNTTKGMLKSPLQFMDIFPVSLKSSTPLPQQHSTADLVFSYDNLKQRNV